MMKHSENENFLLHAFSLRPTTIRREMNIFISPSNNGSMANTKNQFQLNLVKKGQK